MDKLTEEDKAREAHILESWQHNAEPWVTAISGKQISSRVAFTNQAVLEAIQQAAPDTLIDIGCGEGWLCRSLTARGIHCLGVDAVPALIETATSLGGEFLQCRYEDLVEREFAYNFDCAVSNFALLGKSSTEAVFKAIPALLGEKGVFIIQTLHPESACGELPYEDGWREGSWDGFSSEFSRPAPWYFRTLPSWQALFPRFGLELLELGETLNPETNAKLSLLLTARVAG